MTKAKLLAHKIDTRQRVPCVKCGKKFPRRKESTQYCFKCARIESKFDDEELLEPDEDDSGIGLYETQG